MTSLEQSKHEPLARACAELVGDTLKFYPPYDFFVMESHHLYLYQEMLTFTEYISCKNLAGRVFDKYEETYCAKSGSAINDEAFIDAMSLAWTDTPQALQDILEEAGLLGDER